MAGSRMGSSVRRACSWPFPFGASPAASLPLLVGQQGQGERPVGITECTFRCTRAALTLRLSGRDWGLFSPSCDASHLHPAPLQQHQAAQGRPGNHSSSAAGALLFARADRLLLGSDLPRGSMGAAPALGCLGPRPAGGQRLSTHSRLLGDYAAAFGWWPDWLAGKQPRPVPLRLSRLLGLRGSGRDEQQ